YTVTKLLLREFPPFTLGALRFTSAGIILLAIGLPVYNPSLRPGQFPWGTFLLIGFFGVALYSGALNIGLRLTSAVDAALIQAFIPAAFALAAALVLGERLTAGRILGIGLSIVGMALVVGSAGFGGQHNLLGDLLVVLTVVGWVISAVLVKRVSTSVNQTLISGFATFCGALFLIPVSVVELAVVGLPSHVSWTAWGLLTYQALVGSVFAYWCQNTALRHLQASEVASYVNLNSVIGVGLAAIVLGESLLPLQIVGGVLVLGGVYLAATGGGVSRWWARQSPRATPPG
ncbi:MAG: DMT family transporter, partial [Chloroflexota bacterium]|nr:DMT family transporter [Chloroflexota bacterium]